MAEYTRTYHPIPPGTFTGTRIPLSDGATLLIGPPSAFGKMAQAISQDRPETSLRYLHSLRHQRSGGIGRLRGALQRAGLSIASGRRGTRPNDVIRSAVRYVEAGRLVIFILPPLLAHERAADPAELALIPEASALRVPAGVDMRAGKTSATLPKLDFTDMSDKLFYTLSRVPDLMDAGDVAEALRAALTPAVLAGVVVVLAAWAASHFFGVGFAIDAVLLAIGFVLIGWGIFRAMDSLLDALKKIHHATTHAQLDAAAELMGDAIIQLGVETFLALMTRGAAKMAKAGRASQGGGASAGSEAKPKTRGENKKRKKEEEKDRQEKPPPKSRDEIQQEIVDRMGKDFKNHPLRKAYEDEVADLARYKDKIKPNMTDDELEVIAREASKARRDLGVKYKDATPQTLRDYIYQRNMEVYKDPLGPKFEDLLKSKLKKGVSREQALKDIIGSSSRPNKKINKVFEGFNEWLSEQPYDYILKYAS